MSDTRTNSAPNVVVRLLSQTKNLATAREAVKTFTRNLGFNEECCSHIALAVDEAVCNVIRHGYESKPDQPIWINLWALGPADRPRGVRIVIEDEAKQVDPEQIRGRDLENVRPGGLGVHIIREVMENVEYTKRPKGGMSLAMERLLPSAGGGNGISARPKPGEEHTDAKQSGTHQCGGSSSPTQTRGGGRSS